MNYAGTGNAECKRRMDYKLTELKIHQYSNEKNNPEWAQGYVGAVPNGKKIWRSFQQGVFAALIKKMNCM